MGKVIGKKKLVKKLSSNDLTFDESRFIKILKGCQLDIAEWMGNLLGQAAVIEQLERQKNEVQEDDTQDETKDEELVLLLQYLINNEWEKADWLAKQWGEDNLRRWLADPQTNGGFLQVLTLGNFEAKERVLAWMAEKLGGELVQKKLKAKNAQGWTPLVHCLLNSLLEETRWIAEQIEKEQLLLQLNERDHDNQTPLMACIASGLIDSATQITVWLKETPNRIVEQLKSKNRAGRTPLLELFHRKNYHSGEISPALPLIEQWLTQAILTEQLDRRIELGHTPLIYFLQHSALFMAKWIVNQIGKEKAQQQLQSVYENGETAFHYTLPYVKCTKRHTSAIGQLIWLKKMLNTEEWSHRLKSDGSSPSLLMHALQAGDLLAAQWIGSELSKKERIEQLKAYSCSQQGLRRCLQRSLIAIPRIDIADWIAKEIGSTATIDYLESTQESGRPLLIEILFQPSDLCEKKETIEWIAKWLPPEKRRSQLQANYQGEAPIVHLLKRGQVKEAQWIKEQLTQPEVAQQLSRPERESQQPLLHWLVHNKQQEAADWLVELYWPA